MGYGSRDTRTGRLIELQSGGVPSVLMANAVSSGLQPDEVEVVEMSAAYVRALLDAQRVPPPPTLTLEDVIAVLRTNPVLSAAFDATLAAKRES